VLGVGEKVKIQRPLVHIWVTLATHEMTDIKYFIMYHQLLASEQAWRAETSPPRRRDAPQHAAVAPQTALVASAYDNFLGRLGPRL
jgi:hypothetical protein